MGTIKLQDRGGVLVSHKVPEGAEQRKEWKEKGGGGKRSTVLKNVFRCFT